MSAPRYRSPGYRRCTCSRCPSAGETPGSGGDRQPVRAPAVLREPRREVLDRYRPRQVVPLDLGAAHPPEQPPDPLVLHPFGDDVQTQVDAEIDDRPDDRLVVAAVFERKHEALVDLDLVQ